VQNVRPRCREVSAGLLQDVGVVVDVEDAEAFAPLDCFEVCVFENDDEALLLVLDVLRCRVLGRQVDLFDQLRGRWVLAILFQNVSFILNRDFQEIDIKKVTYSLYYKSFTIVNLLS